MIVDLEAERMQDIPFSNIRKVFEKVSKLRAKGVNPIPFHIGQPDFDTPEHIKQAAKDALDCGLTAYTSNYGLPDLRQEIAAKLLRENGIPVDPETQIIVTVGTNEAVHLAMMAFLNPGDEVIMPDPTWPHYVYCAQLAGANVVYLPLHEENAFQLDPDELEHLVSPRTKMLLLNSPHNPTGVVFSLETVHAVARIVERHNLILLSDEIYEKMIYGDVTHYSLGAIESIRDQTITVNGFSKSYSMTGWRIGYVAASPKLIAAMIRVHQYTTICATSFAQAGALAALRGPQTCVSDMLAEFSRRRQEIIQGFEGIPQAKLIPPQGTFYAFFSIKALGQSSEAISSRLLEEFGIAVIPGNAFGKYGEGFIRLSFACSLPQVQQGMQSIVSFWQIAAQEGKI